jgi:uncharacterized protein (DUF2225 family)
MSSETPFLLFKIECPICKTVNEFEQLKVGAYVEGGRDTDFCPRDIQWRYPKYQAYNPLLFFTANCSNCYYTRELTNKYREWKTDNAFRTIKLKTLKEKHLEQLSVSDSIIKKLGMAIDVRRYPNESAILKLHLAIFDGLLSEHPGNLDLGRYYLRIGWVFRDLDRGENPHQVLLGRLLREIDDRYFRLKEGVEHSRRALDDMSASIRAHFAAEQIPAELQSQMYGHRDRYAEEIDELHQLVGTTLEKLVGVKEHVDEYRLALMGDGTTDGQQAFGEHRSFREFLRHLRTSWEGVVTDEREALEKAIHHYKEAFARGRDIAPGTQQIQASYLIAELSRRVGDYDGARQYFTSTIKAGQEFIYRNRRDQARTVLARKILELAIEQGRANLKASKLT